MATIGKAWADIAWIVTAWVDGAWESASTLASLINKTTVYLFSKRSGFGRRTWSIKRNHEMVSNSWIRKYR